MNLNLWQETKPVSGSNSLVMAIYKNSAPTVVVDFFALPGPYSGQTQLHTFAGLASVVYQYKLFESPDGSPTGVIRNSFEIQPNSNAYNVRDDLDIKAGTSPFLLAYASVYGPDPSLIGWNYGLERVGAGTMEYGVDYVKTVAGVDTTQDDTTADGWRLLRSGDVAGDGERFVAHFLPQLQATSTVEASAMISNTLLLTANTTLDNSAAGQAFLLQGVGGFFTVNLPDINTVPDNEPLFFNSAGGNHVNVALAASAGQKLLFFQNQSDLGSNTPASVLYLAQCENLWMYKFTFPITGTKIWLVFGGEGCRVVGEVIYQYSKIPLNTVFANGQTLSRTNNARLWQLVSNLEAGIVINDSNYNDPTTINGKTYFLNHGKYTFGDESTTFRVPTLWRLGYQKAVNGASGANSYNGVPGILVPQSVGTHDHTTHGKGPINDSSHSSSPQWFLSILNGAYAASGSNLFGRSNTPDNNMRTSDNTNANAAGENLPASYGAYALIRY